MVEKHYPLATRKQLLARIQILEAAVRVWIDAEDMPSAAFEDKYGKVIHEDPTTVGRDALGVDC